MTARRPRGRGGTAESRRRLPLVRGVCARNARFAAHFAATVTYGPSAEKSSSRAIDTTRAWADDGRRREGRSVRAERGRRVCDASRRERWRESAVAERARRGVCVGRRSGGAARRRKRSEGGFEGKTHAERACGKAIKTRPRARIDSSLTASILPSLRWGPGVRDAPSLDARSAAARRTLIALARLHIYHAVERRGERRHRAHPRGLTERERGANSTYRGSPSRGTR